MNIQEAFQYAKKNTHSINDFYDEIITNISYKNNEFCVVHFIYFDPSDSLDNYFEYNHIAEEPYEFILYKSTLFKNIPKRSMFDYAYCKTQFDYAYCKTPDPLIEELGYYIDTNNSQFIPLFLDNCCPIDLQELEMESILIQVFPILQSYIPNSEPPTTEQKLNFIQHAKELIDKRFNN